MKLLKLNEGELSKLEKVNTQVRNTILVPCCYVGLPGTYVNLDDMLDVGDTFLVHRQALSPFKTVDVVEGKFEGVGIFDYTFVVKGK